MASARADKYGVVDASFTYPYGAANSGGRQVVTVVQDDGRKFLAFYERDGVVAGVVGGGMPGKVMKARNKIASGAPIGDVLG